MSLSEILIKIVGCVLVIVGLGIVLAAVGVNFLGVALAVPAWLAIVIGLIFMGAGIWIIRGGTITA